jgi:hypothetical protein
MYKARIKRWGLAKHLTVTDVHTLLRDRASHEAVGKSTTLLIRGQPVDQKKVEQYLRRTRREDFRYLSDAWRAAKGGQNPPSTATLYPGMKSPADFRLPEEVMLLARQLVFGSHEGRRWVPGEDKSLKFASDVSVKWDYKMSIGLLLINNKQYKHAFKVLDSAFAMLGQLIEGYDPAIFIYVMTNMLWLHEDLGQKLLSYVAAMAQTKLTANHPMAMVWDRLNRAGLKQAKICAWPMLVSYLDTLENLFGDYKKDLLFIIYWLYNDAYFSGLMSGEGCVAKIRETVKLAESYGQRTHILQAKSILAILLTKIHQYEEARILRNEIDKENHKEGEVCNKSIEEECMRIRFDICKEVGTAEEAVQAGRDCLQYLKDKHGPGHTEVLWMASRLQQYYDDLGMTENVETLEESLNPDWDAFCRGLES